MRLSYSWVKDALRSGEPGARSIGPAGATGGGESLAPALANCCTSTAVGTPGWRKSAPDHRATLVAIPDDATNRVLYAQLWAGETTVAVMTALREVFTAMACRWRSTATARAGRFTPRRRRAPSIRSG